MSARKIAFSAALAAIYIVISLIPLYQFSFGVIQFRLSEALTVLPFVTPLAIPGLFVGCFVTNLFSPFGLIDIVFGSTATLLAAMLTSKMPTKWLAPVPPIVVNGLVVGAVLTYMLAPGNFAAVFPINALSVAVSETVVCFCFGLPLLYVMQKYTLFSGVMDNRHIQKS